MIDSEGDDRHTVALRGILGDQRTPDALSAIAAQDDTVRVMLIAALKAAEAARLMGNERTKRRSREGWERSEVRRALPDLRKDTLRQIIVALGHRVYSYYTREQMINLIRSRLTYTPDPQYPREFDYPKVRAEVMRLAGIEP